MVVPATSNLIWKTLPGCSYQEIMATMSAERGSPVLSYFFNSGDFDSAGANVAARTYDATPMWVPESVGGSTCMRVALTGQGYTREASPSITDFRNLDGVLFLQLDDPEELFGSLRLRFLTSGSNVEINIWAPGGGGDDAFQNEGVHCVPFTTSRPPTVGTLSDLASVTSIELRWLGGAGAVSDNPAIICEAMHFWAKPPSRPCRINLRMDDTIQNPSTGALTYESVLACNAAGFPVTISLIEPFGLGTSADGIITKNQCHRLVHNQIADIYDGTDLVVSNITKRNQWSTHMSRETDDSDSWGTADPGSDRYTDNVKYTRQCMNALLSAGVYVEDIFYCTVPQGAMQVSDDYIAKLAQILGYSWTGKAMGSGQAGTQVVMPDPLPTKYHDNALFWNGTVASLMGTLFGTVAGSVVEDCGGGVVVYSNGYLAQIGKGVPAQITIYWHAPNQSVANVEEMVGKLAIAASKGWLYGDTIWQGRRDWRTPFYSARTDLGLNVDAPMLG